VSFEARNQCSDSDLSPIHPIEPIDVSRSDRAFRWRRQGDACPAAGSFSGGMLHPKYYWSEFGYGPGRKVSETRHTVLGRHTETGQPTLSGLGSG